MKKIYKIIIVVILILAVIISIILYNLTFKNNKNNVNIYNDNPLYSYNRPIVPEGFKKVETEAATWELDENNNVKGWNDGLVIEDEKGNQFVWVPCTIDGKNNTTKYSRYYSHMSIDNFWEEIKSDEIIDGGISTINGIKIKSKYVDTSPVNLKILDNVTKYSGFYIGRFQTGIENGITSKDTKNENTCYWLKWNDGKAVVKKNAKIWNYITFEKSLEVSNTIVNYPSVKSSLVTSFCFDTVLTWMDNSYDDFRTNRKYGSYIYDDFISDVITGAKENRKLKNIYDFVGIGQFTTELHVNTPEKTFPVVRGSTTSSTNNPNEVLPTVYMYRETSPHNFTSGLITFRVILYIE